MSLPQRSGRLLAVCAAVLGISLASAATAQAEIELVSRSSLGAQARAASYQPAMSAGGRYVAFVSDADNLVENDPASRYVDPDIFVYDRDSGNLESPSAPLNSGGWSFLRTICREPSIDAEGRFVAFECYSGWGFAHSLKFDVYLHDRLNGSLALVTQTPTGQKSNGGSAGAVLSADGRYIAFSSQASNLHPFDRDSAADVYLYDREDRVFELLSVAGDGTKGNGPSLAPAISADGRYIAFASAATNLAGNGAPAGKAVYLRDRQSGTTERLELPAGMAGDCDDPAISADGRLVAFSVGVDGVSQILLADRATGGVRALTAGSAPSLSGDGRFLAFVADGQIQKLDLSSSRCEPVSLAASGEAGDAPSATPSLSLSGAELAFASAASNLYAADGNGTDDVFLQTASADITPPELELSVTPGVLWPPNKKYVPVTIGGLAADDVELASVEISVSDEYGEMVGMFVPGFDSTVWLEAWREGDDMDGRIYTITAVALDAAGNRTEKSVQAIVPHDMRDKKR